MRIRRRRLGTRRWSAAVLLGAALASGAVAEDWDGWRGPRRDGSSVGSPWPDRLDGLRQRWQIPLGRGYSGPLVAGDRIFVVETIDDDTVGVRAVARGDGSELWTRRWAGSGRVPFFARQNGDWVRSTPAFDGETLYVGDMAEVIVALDGASGALRWQVDVPARFGTAVPEFGFASSPLVDGGLVYLQAANSVLALDAADGETRWRALELGGEASASGAFSSPVIAEVAGVRQLVVLTRRQLAGLDLASGEVLWRQDLPSFRGMHILTPVVVGDTLFTSPYRERSYGLGVSRSGESFAVETLWTNPVTGYMSSPVVVDGTLYLLLGNGRFAALELATGRTLWRTTERFGRYWSTVTRGDRLLALDETGELRLVHARPESFELLDTRRVGPEESWAHLAVSGSELFVRGLETLAAWDWRPSPTAAAEVAVKRGDTAG